MRMILADDIADHARAFLKARGGIEVQLVHGVDQPPMHRLQPVAQIRQRARHDGGQRIGEVALAQRLRQPGIRDASDQIVRHPTQLRQSRYPVIERHACRRQRQVPEPEHVAGEKVPGQAETIPPLDRISSPSPRRNGGKGSIREAQFPAPSAVKARPDFGLT